MSLSDKERQAKRRAKKKQAGEVCKQWWVMPEWVESIEKLLAKLRKKL